MEDLEDIFTRVHAVIMAGCERLDDKTASIAPEVFGGLKADGSLVKAGTRIDWNGALKKASVDLWDTGDNNPENAPALWADLPYKNGYRIIPEVITVTEAFAEGEWGWWGETLYRSKADSNVYTPEQHPESWEKAA